MAQIGQFQSVQLHDALLSSLAGVLRRLNSTTAEDEESPVVSAHHV